MESTITQRELRSDIAEIMLALEGGDSLIITRNGVPVGRLLPIQRRTFVPTSELQQSAARLPLIDLKKSKPIPTHTWIKIRSRVPKPDRPSNRVRGSTDISLLEVATDRKLCCLFGRQGRALREKLRKPGGFEAFRQRRE